MTPRELFHQALRNVLQKHERELEARTEAAIARTAARLFGSERAAAVVETKLRALTHAGELLDAAIAELSDIVLPDSAAAAAGADPERQEAAA